MIALVFIFFIILALIIIHFSSTPNGNENYSFENNKTNEKITNMLNKNDEDIVLYTAGGIKDYYGSGYNGKIDIFKMQHVERVIYIVYYFNMRIRNGGIRRYLNSVSKDELQYLPECLSSLGADKTLELFTIFINENNIDISNDSFKYETKNEAFDSKINECENLESMLAQYIRDNIEQINYLKADTEEY